MTGFRAVSFLTVLSSPLAGCTVFWVFFFFLLLPCWWALFGSSLSLWPLWCGLHPRSPPPGFQPQSRVHIVARLMIQKGRFNRQSQLSELRIRGLPRSGSSLSLQTLEQVAFGWPESCLCGPCFSLRRQEIVAPQVRLRPARTPLANSKC